MKKIVTLFSLVFLPLVQPVETQAAPPVFRSHDAVYVMKHQPQAVSRGQTPVNYAEGVLRYSFRNVCDGWTVKHQSLLFVSLEGGSSSQISWEYTSWESKEGDQLRFYSRTQRNGGYPEIIDGEASKQDGKTILSFRAPVKKELEIPQKTFFPTSHLMKSIDLVKSGEQIFNAHYFDGSAVDQGYELDLVMVPHQGKKLRDVSGVTLSDQPVWAMQLGFHRPDVSSLLPDFEIGATYRQDGISTALRQDYGDFILQGKLEELTYSDEPDCR